MLLKGVPLPIAIVTHCKPRHRPRGLGHLSVGRIGLLSWAVIVGAFAMPPGSLYGQTFLLLWSAQERVGTWTDRRPTARGRRPLGPASSLSGCGVAPSSGGRADAPRRSPRDGLRLPAFGLRARRTERPPEFRWPPYAAVRGSVAHRCVCDKARRDQPRRL